MTQIFSSNGTAADRSQKHSAGALAVLGALALAIVLSFRRMADSDLWGHLACGDYFLSTKSILTTHFFNNSWPDFPYVNHSWFFQVVVAFIHRVSGEPGLMALQVALIALAFLLVYRTMRLESGDKVWLAVILVLGILASMHRFSLRPQHFSYVFLLYFLLALRRAQRWDLRLAWFLPLIMLAWVNMHAESFWGFVVLITYLAVEGVKLWNDPERSRKAWKTLLIIGSITVAAALLNPFTYRTVFWPLFVMKEQFAGVEEILPSVGRGFLFFHLYFALFLLSLVFNMRRADPTWLVMSLGFAAVAWTANRGIPHFVFVSAPFIAGNIREIRSRIESRNPAPRWAASVGSLAVLGIIAALILSVVTSPRYLRKYDNIPYPENALTFLRTTGVRGNVFNEHGWGGFIIWNAYPDLKPYIDGRFFHRRFYDEYYPLLAGQPGWDAVLERYGITIAMLRYSPGAHARLNDRLFADPRWHLVYWDDISLVYLRESPSTRNVIASVGAMPVNPDRELFSDIDAGDRTKARQANDAAEKNLPRAGNSFKAYILAANTWYALGDFDRALQRYLGSLHAVERPDPWVYYRIALCYRAKGELEQAEVFLQKTTDLVPDSRVAADLLREVRFLLDARRRPPAGR